MPVKGLMLGLMEMGKIKIGIKGDITKSKEGNEFRLPQKIDHFRIVKNERDENDDYVIDDQIYKAIGQNKATILNSENHLIGIPVRLLYNEIDLVFPTQYVSYVNGKLSCSGDGVKAHTRDGRETKCPCSRLDGAYTGKDKCKISGTLSCIIEGSNVGGCYKFRTTSINSARYILSSLMLIKAATGGLLSFIPLRLVINPKKTIIPATGAPTTIYVVTVEFQGGIEELQQKALAMGKERVSLIENMRDIEREARAIVSYDSDAEIEREEKEFAEEFFPDNIEQVNDQIQEQPKQEPIKEPLKKAKYEITSVGKTETVDITMAGSEKSESSSEKKPGPKKDELLGEATPTKTDVIENQTTDADSQIVEKITHDQLRTILSFKNELKIKSAEAWAKTIADMKFPGIVRANDMNKNQGAKFIEKLRILSGNEAPY